MVTISYDDPLIWMVAVLLVLATGLACALLAETRAGRPDPHRRRHTSNAEQSTLHRPR